MNRIDRKFRLLKKLHKKALIAYVTAGDPNAMTTGSIVLSLEKQGVDIVELGIPFSDPIADGPTIQAASQRALKRGMSLKKSFLLVEKIRRSSEIPLVFMTYFNPVLRYGLQKFFRNCSGLGVDGVIIPDLPCEESREVSRLGKSSGVSTIFLVAPTSGLKRIKMICRNSTGFIYYVSLTGVTGARTELPDDIFRQVKRIKSVTSKPVAVGFGISTATQAAKVACAADGVIIGSAIVKLIAGGKKSVVKVSRFAKTLARAVHGQK